MKTDWREHQYCRSCGKGLLKQTIDLGVMPPANSFLKRAEIKNEKSFPLRLAVCPKCFLVQLQDTVDPEILFARDYYYMTGASAPLVRHFEEFGNRLVKEFGLNRQDLVVEMGSNDGILLSAISPYGRVLGVDPAANMKEEAKKRGVPTLTAFFGENSARKILRKEGPARIVLGNNVFAHIDDIHDVMRGVRELLSPDGQFIAEVHWVGNLMGAGGFDQIYHEHIYYFSVHALKHLIEDIHGLTLSRVELIPVHGESLRIFVSKDKKVDSSVAALLKKEKSLGLHKLETHLSFGEKVNQVKEALLSKIKSLKSKNKKIIGYGAPAKGNTLLNFCGIGPTLIDYIVDTTPSKQKMLTPGSHIKVFSPDILKKEKPDYILLLSWNYADAILEKEKELRKRGVKFIIPVPEVRIL